jgi:hypothetical protein
MSRDIPTLNEWLDGRKLNRLDMNDPPEVTYSLFSDNGNLLDWTTDESEVAEWTTYVACGVAHVVVMDSKGNVIDNHG